MTKQELLELYDYFDLVQGVTLKAIAQVPVDQLDFRAQPEVRSLRELVSHMFSSEKVHAQAAAQGQLAWEDIESEYERGLQAADLSGFARECHREARAILERLPAERVGSIVKLPYGDFPAWKMFSFSYDEHWHHRGQLYAYLRLIHIEPVFLYDY